MLLQQGDKRWVLGTEDAGSAVGNQLGHITWHIQIPADVEAGRTLLVADVPPRGNDPMDARLHVVVSRRESFVEPKSDT